MNKTRTNPGLRSYDRQDKTDYEEGDTEHRGKPKWWVIFECILLGIMVVGFFLCFAVLADDACNVDSVQAWGCIRGAFSMYGSLLAIGVLCVRWLYTNAVNKKT
jgi:hypothetical protein